MIRKIMPRLLTAIFVVLGLVLVLSATPAMPWLREKLFPEESATPTISPVAMITPEVSPPSTPQATATPVISKVLSFSEAELQAKVDELANILNSSTSAKVEYLQVKLEPDRMLVSAKGQAKGLEAQTEDLELRFQGRTVFVAGTLTASGFSVTPRAEIEIITEAGKPSIAVKKLTGILPLKFLLGIDESKVTGLVNGLIQSRNVTLPFDIESISIENARLVIIKK